MLVKIALMVTQTASGRVNHPTNWVNDSAPNLPNKRDMGPPPAAISGNNASARELLDLQALISGQRRGLTSIYSTDST